MHAWVLPTFSFIQINSIQALLAHVSCKPWNTSIKSELKVGLKVEGFCAAMTPDAAKSMYEAFVENLKKAYKPEHIQTGQFQTKMSKAFVLIF